MDIVAVVRSAQQKEIPAGVQAVVYDRGDDERLDDLRFPSFLRSLKADVCHVPLNAVPLMMPKPYVVTVHDMSSLLFPTSTGFDQHWKAYRFRRGLLRADQVIAVSKATKRDVQNVMGVRTAGFG